MWRPLFELPRRFELIESLVRRELAARYRGSVLGVVWAVVTPAVMIAIYTFIFAGLFGARFGSRGTTWDYALYLFCGLLPWTTFQESAQRAADVIGAHANLVKRVVFPLEALPVAGVLAACFTQLCGTLVLLGATLVIHRELHASILWWPLLMVPQLLATLGAAWLFASLGVFLRDTGQALGLILVAWMFLTPIIYPESVVPPRFQPFINANPFTPLVRNYRRILLEGAPPDWRGLLYFTVFALALFLGGYWWFAKTRRSFADVI